MPPSERATGVSGQLARPEYGLSSAEADERLVTTFALRDLAVVVGQRRGTGIGSGLLGAGMGEPLREGHRLAPEAGGSFDRHAGFAVLRDTEGVKNGSVTT